MKKRDGIEIRVWLTRRKIRTIVIARETGLVQSTVARTIDGERNCRAVLRWLLDNGCPARLLDLPADMREGA